MKFKIVKALSQYVAIFILLSFVIFSLVFFKDFSRNLAWLGGGKSVHEGTYFNLTVGSDATQIKPTLSEMGFEDVSAFFSLEERLLNSSDAGKNIDDTYIFSDDSFRTGIIYVSVRNGKIVEIRSDYSASMW